MIDQYFKIIKQLMNKIQIDQNDVLRHVANKSADAIEKDGLIQFFGAGHSHIFGEEVFYRAGGLVPIKPILDEDVMLHRGAVRSSELEKSSEYAQALVKRLDIKAEDLVIVASTSGRNPVPIEVATYAKEQGAFVVALTSLAYSNSQKSKHLSGKRLAEVADVTIDNLSEKGDAALEHENVKVPFGPTSTVVGACIINAIIAETIVQLSKRGIEPPVLLSGNLDGANEHNEKIIQHYRKRIPML
ncbi:SIS domain-containing protein [Salipaludibacillus daqingensis]|uniref:SIS domain-containing protein n=1 Tax=Salipaludibacillus daqingensis TaxID=3041001 RepID=UPI0024740149|nr:SIS domain-containing protein [Salipaludibacillus daqingensis]